MDTSTGILRAFMMRVNMSSQTVQVFGFIRLGRMPKARKGTEARPCSGTGIRICCQQPLQIIDRDGDMHVALQAEECGCLSRISPSRSEDLGSVHR